jgi:hypothetical protein
MSRTELQSARAAKSTRWGYRQPMPVVAVIVLLTLALALAGLGWLIIMLGRGMARDKDAMQIGPYNAWSPPPPSPPFPGPDERDGSK